MGKGILLVALAAGIVIIGANSEKNKGSGGKSGGGGEYQDILDKAGLQAYKPPPASVFKDKPEDKETKKATPPKSRESVFVGSYEVIADRREKTCSIKLYEYLENGNRKLRGTWSGDVGACNHKVNQTVTAIEIVRGKKKTPEDAPGKVRYIEPSNPVTYDIWFETNKQNQKPLSLAAARDMAKAISFATKDIVQIMDNKGHVEDTYNKGVRVS